MQQEGDSEEMDAEELARQAQEVDRKPVKASGFAAMMM